MDKMKKFDIIEFEKLYSHGKSGYETSDLKVIMIENDDSYEIQTIPKDKGMMVCHQYLFYSDTLSIMKEGAFLKHGGEKIGIWNVYDSQGTLTEQIDEDKGWNAKWNDVEESLLKDGIRLDSINSIQKEEIEEDIHIWRVSIALTGLSSVSLTIDSNNGSILYAEEIIDV